MTNSLTKWTNFWELQLHNSGTSSSSFLCTRGRWKKLLSVKKKRLMLCCCWSIFLRLMLKKVTKKNPRRKLLSRKLAQHWFPMWHQRPPALQQKLLPTAAQISTQGFCLRSWVMKVLAQAMLNHRQGWLPLPLDPAAPAEAWGERWHGMTSTEVKRICWLKLWARLLTFVLQ